MMGFIQYLRDFNLCSILIRLTLAMILSCIVGIERGKHGRAAGLRTHMLVCVGATITSLTSLYIQHELCVAGDVSRISAQVVSGIGFLGAGTILVKNKSIVTGLTTAACIWATGCMGIAIGYGFYEAAIASTILLFVITGLFGKVDRKLVRGTKEISMYIEFIDAKLLNDTINAMKNKGLHLISIHPVQAKTNLMNGIGADIIIRTNDKFNADTVINELNTMENVNFAIATLL